MFPLLLYLAHVLRISATSQRIMRKYDLTEYDYKDPLFLLMQQNGIELSFQIIVLRIKVDWAEAGRSMGLPSTNSNKSIVVSAGVRKTTCTTIFPRRLSGTGPSRSRTVKTTTSGAQPVKCWRRLNRGKIV